MENEVEIVCQGCGVTFVHTPRNGRNRRAPAQPPTHCSLCRAEQRRPADAAAKPKYTGDPNEYRSPMACDEPEPRRPRHNGPRKPRPERTQEGADSNRGRLQRRRRQMFSAVCAKCGATAHVPFQPSRFQEVLCRSCFQEKRGRGRPAADPPTQQ